MPESLSRASPKTFIDVVDMHTAGEPVRIITGGYPELTGATILDKRREAQARHDHIRRALMLEPRGHAGMYGVIPCAPSAQARAQGADLACLFTHASGYSTMCGHATIAIGRWAVEAGLVDHRMAPDRRSARFGLELPCGIVTVEARIEEGRVVASGYESAPAFVSELDVAIEVPGLGPVTLDIVFGGAFYAILPVSRLGLDFEAPLKERIGAGMAVFHALRAQRPAPCHPDEPDLSFLYGVILTDDAKGEEDTRNLCLFGEGQIDRSPTGSGVTARMALDLARGHITQMRSRRFLGPTCEAFTASAWRDGAATRARVEGRSFHSARARFEIEADDPLGEGFLLFPSEAQE